MSNDVSSTADDVNVFFLLQGAVLVFFMQAGFAMLEGQVNGGAFCILAQVVAHNTYATNKRVPS